jgi:hypothetical protein
MDAVLEAVLAGAWALLARAAADRRHPARVVQLATRGADGAPRLRSVILRGADAAARTMRFHTDRRSAKVAEIAADPRAALLLWDPRSRVQLRLAGRARVITAGPAWQAAWGSVPASARRDYAGPAPPGTPLAAPVPTEGGIDPAAQFALVILAVEALDWLGLERHGHRRARFILSGEPAHATWLVP